MTGIILIIILVALPLLAYATARSPEMYQMDIYLWVIGLSLLGGIVSFKEKRKSGFWTFRTGSPRLGIALFILVNTGFFLLELLTSAFCGILTFYICESVHMDRLLTAAFVGLSGFAGGRMLNFLINLAQAVLEKKFEVNVVDRENHETD
ncbi:MAG: hypothetical protein GX776_09325 [Oxalobacter sp.]|nr:hypothetical protein [Oxalobacter sp.]